MLADELHRIERAPMLCGDGASAAADSEAMVLETLLELNTLLSRRIEEETAKAMEREHLLLRQAHRATMGEMIGIIAHQWRQPLGALGLILQNLRYDSRDGVLDRLSLEAYLDRAQAVLGQMADTIDDFRLFFTQESTQERFGLLATIRKCADLVSASLRTHGIELSITGDEVFVHGRENEFLHVMVNLVVNAKDALLERQVAHGRIAVGLGRDGDDARLCVSDNAGGIPAEVFERIFDPYFTTKKTGFGIGLYLTRTIVEQHMHGRIWAENWQHGTRFTIRLPACEAPAQVG